MITSITLICPVLLKGDEACVASQEFLASFGVEIDEAGVARLQNVLEENRALAEELAAAFSEATAAIGWLVSELSADLPGLFPGTGSGIASEGLTGAAGSLPVSLDLAKAQADLSAFTTLAKKPIPLSANASGVVSAGRAAYESVRSLFSAPLTISARVKKDGEGDGTGGVQRMSTGGRFTRPTDVQVAEDGDAEYIIPVKKEDRAVPLLKQLLSELSPAARESLSGPGLPSLSGGMAAGNTAVGSITQNNQNVSAPVNIHVSASGGDAEQIGRGVYNAAERYLLRTLKGVMA